MNMEDEIQVPSSFSYRYQRIDTEAIGYVLCNSGNIAGLFCAFSGSGINKSSIERNENNDYTIYEGYPVCRFGNRNAEGSWFCLPQKRDDRQQAGI